MADQPKVPVTPAPAAAAPAAPAPVASNAPDDLLVEVKVDGKVLKEPVKNLRESYQLRSAAEKRFTEAQALRDRNQAAVQLYERLDNATDPEAMLDTIRAQLEQRHGRPLKTTKTTSPETDVSDDVNPATRENDRRIKTLEARIAQLDARTSAGDVQSEADRVLGAYPQYQKGHEAFDPDAREQAELVLLATKVKYPNRPFDEIAASMNTSYVNTIERALTRTRDRREAATADHAGLPPSQANASLTERQRFTLADAKNGKAKGALQQMIGQGRGLLNFRK